MKIPITQVLIFEGKSVAMTHIKARQILRVCCIAKPVSRVGEDASVEIFCSSHIQSIMDGTFEFGSSWLNSQDLVLIDVSEG